MTEPARNFWHQPSDASLECSAMAFIRIELELALTFVRAAQTEYSMGNVALGEVSRNNAEKAYRAAFHYFEQLSEVHSLERWELMGLLNQVKMVIIALAKPATR